MRSCHRETAHGREANGRRPLPLLHLLGALASRRSLRIAGIATLLLAQVSARRESGGADAKDGGGLNPEEIRNMARLGKGYLVWERNRDQSWQIWSKQLDGTGERRLVPAEEGRDHFCPKVSPDGALMAYMSYPAGAHPYPASRTHVGALWLMNLRTGAREMLAAEAHSYAEDRAVTWRDNSSLCYINVRGETIERNLATREERRVIDFHDDKFGYLPSPDLSHATSGGPEFAPVGKGGILVHQKLQDGCQPYFTSDSRWGFWMAGAGGPIQAMLLATRHVHPILERRDPRMPKDRNYAYFPMVSSCMRLLAFAASTNQHSHFEGNYDLFVAPLNPRTLRMIGRPVRYTRSTNCDRYPDVFRRELDLGTHFVEGETTVRFAPPRGRNVYDFDFGDGATAHGRTARHTFRKPGTYWITATRGKDSGRQTLRGYVHVDPPSPPSVVQMHRQGQNSLLVEFGEPVNLSAATARIGDGPPLPFAPAAADHGMLIELPADVDADASLTLDGVRDTAEQPNRMARSVIALRALDWPVSTKGLVFAWRDAFAKEPGAGGRLIPSGLAFWNRHGALQLRGGWCDAPDDGRRISEACARSGAFSVEAVLVSEPGDETLRDSVILALADAGAGGNLLLKQRGKLVSLEIRDDGAATGGSTNLPDLFGLDPAERRHIVLTFRDGETRLYVGGARRNVPIPKLGAIAGWRPQSLRLGAAPDGARPWRGSLERVAFYDRALAEEEIQSHAKSWEFATEGRSVPYEWTALARLVERTPPPSLAEIQPYKEALVRQRYEVIDNLNGDGLLPREIVVSQWAWLGGKPMPAQALKVGDTVRLTLHEAEAHPELKSLMVQDHLQGGFDARLFHDAGAWDRPLEKQ